MDVVDLYLRKSNKDDRRSVGRQEGELVREAANAGLTVGRVFIDPDLSASRFAKKPRPDYAALLDHINSGQCRVIGIDEPSRGSRNNTEWNQFLDIVRAKQIKIWVRTYGRILDPGVRARDWKDLAEDGVTSAYESEVLSERVLSGKRAGAAAGRPAGRAIYGHQRRYDDRGKLIAVEPHPTQAPIVRELIARIVKGDKLFAIAADLNSRGVAAPGGGTWRSVTVRQTAMRPAHIGQRVHHGEVIGAASWDGIVDERAWRRAVAILTAPDRRTQRGTALAHWVSGAVLCGACREDHLRPVTRGRYGCKGCYGVSVPREALERAIEAAIFARLDQEDAASIFTASNDADPEIAMLDKELGDIEVSLSSLYAEARARRITPQALAAIEPGLIADQARIRAKIRALSLPQELAEFEGMNIRSEWPDLAPEQRRKILRGLAEIVVEGTKKRGPKFDLTRLDESRWIGDEMTWGERRVK